MFEVALVIVTTDPSLHSYVTTHPFFFSLVIYINICNNTPLSSFVLYVTIHPHSSFLCNNTHISSFLCRFGDCLPSFKKKKTHRHRHTHRHTPPLLQTDIWKRGRLTDTSIPPTVMPPSSCLSLTTAAPVPAPAPAPALVPVPVPAPLAAGAASPASA